MPIGDRTRDGHLELESDGAIPTDGPRDAQTSGLAKRRRRGYVLAMCAITLGLVCSVGVLGLVRNRGGTSIAAESDSTVVSPRTVSNDRLDAAALEVVERRTGTRPTSGVSYTTTRETVSAVEVTGVNEDADVKYYVFHGDFTDLLAHHPPGVASPKGKTVTLVFDLDSGGMLDWGITEGEINDARLGDATPVDVS